MAGFWSKPAWSDAMAIFMQHFLSGAGPSPRCGLNLAYRTHGQAT